MGKLSPSVKLSLSVAPDGVWDLLFFSAPAIVRVEKTLTPTDQVASRGKFSSEPKVELFTRYTVHCD